MDYVMNELYPHRFVEWFHKVTGPVEIANQRVGTEVYDFRDIYKPVHKGLIWGKIVHKDGLKVAVHWENSECVVEYFPTGLPMKCVPWG